jgi:hypothetical protein
VGSPLVVDFEASLARAGVHVAAAVQNVPGEVHLLDTSKLRSPADLTEADKGLPYVVPLFTPANRQQAAREAAASGFTKPYSLIDPSVACLYAAEDRGGLYVNSGCSVGAACRFGQFVLVNRGASLGHHARLDCFVSIGPGAVLAGSVSVGRGAVIGAGAVVLPQLTIGANAVVGAGAVVTRDVPEHCLAVGNPARIVKQGIAGFGNRCVD